jgi:maleamate amidohydrolase
MTRPASDEEFFKDRGFGLRMGFGDQPALLIVDLIKAFTDPNRMLGANLDPQIAATMKLLDAAHDSELPVLLSSVKYEDADLRDAGIWCLKQKGSVTLRSDTDGHEIDPRLTVRPSDSILMKKYASCFFGTDLVSRLVSRKVDTLVIAGCTTSGCVRATAVDALQNGFRPIIVREAVGDRSQSAHDQSLFDLNAKYADVVGLEEAVRYLTNVRQDAANKAQ